jgi:hypothetical protein
MPGLPELPPLPGGVMPGSWTEPVQPAADTEMAASAAPIKSREENCVTGLYLRQSDPRIRAYLRVFTRLCGRLNGTRKKFELFRPDVDIDVGANGRQAEKIDMQRAVLVSLRYFSI